MTEAKINIEGMSCQHCVMSVRRAVEGLAGVKDLTVEVGEAKVAFDESTVQRKDIEDVIIKAGYKIKSS